MSAALIGMKTLRNTAISSSALSSTTIPTNSGSLSAMTLVKSSCEATCPPTETSAPVARSTARQRSSPRNAVQQLGRRLARAGRSWGTSMMVAIAPSLESCGGGDRGDVGIARDGVGDRCGGGRVALARRSTASRNEPFMPAPKPSAMRS